VLTSVTSLDTGRLRAQPPSSDTASHVSRIISLFIVALVGLMVFVPAAFAGDGGGEAAPPDHPGAPIPGQYIVEVSRVSDPSAIAAAAGAHSKFVYRNAIKGFAAELNDHQVEALRHNPHVTAIEQDQVVKADSTEYLSGGQPWGLDRIDQRFGLDASYVYGYSGAGVRAYVIDSGIQTNHPDFGTRALAMFDAFEGTSQYNAGQDCNGHGTHVAGTIGGATYGVAKSALLRAVRVLDCTASGSTSTVIAGVDWVRANAIHPAVANMSLEGGYSALENQAVTNLVNAGVFVAVAAGNKAMPACYYSPASAPGTFTAAASSSSDARAWFSDYGACVDGYAPGVGVLSDWIGSRTNYDSGTSMASPHVAGVIALAKSAYGDGYSSPSWVNWLVSNSTPNVISGNPTGTPNLLLYKGAL
jgi:subtilisin family serine protease